MTTATVVIVDAYSTGSDLARHLHELGVELIHVQSSASLPQFYLKSFIETLFSHCLGSEKTPDEVASALANFAPVAILAGAETGVPLADYLNCQLGIPWNLPASSRLRRNKYEMIEALHKTALPAAKQKCIENLQELEAYMNIMDLNLPIVVKPLESAGTDGVRFCHSSMEILDAAKNILGRPNRLGILNQAVLLQEKLIGAEFVVNAVSFHGEHLFTEFWALQKKNQPGAGAIYDYDELLPLEGDLFQLLSNYVSRCLDALGIKYGPSHSELILTQTGPRLVECGARIQGSTNPAIINECFGSSQMHIVASLAIDPSRENFRHWRDTPRIMRKKALWVQLMASEDSVVSQEGFAEAVQKVPSFYAGRINLEKGRELNKTIDLFTSPGDVFLLHQDRDQLFQDYELIRHIEHQYFRPIAA